MTTPYRVQFLDAYSAVIREYHADAHSISGAVALVEGLPWPQDATKLRLLDADGRDIHTRSTMSPEAEEHTPVERLVCRQPAIATAPEIDPPRLDDLG